MSRLTSQPHTTLVIPVEDRERLAHLARELGFVQTRGAGTGKIGSISALMRAIASEEVRLVAGKKPSQSDRRTED